MSGHGGSRKTVLVVDDDLALLEVLGIRLRHLGLNVVADTDAVHALANMEQKPPDVAILDVGLPTGNGLAICEMMMFNLRLSHIPVIVLTGSTAEDIVARCRSLGAHYVHKSLDCWNRIRELVVQLLSLETRGCLPAPPAPGPRMPGAGDEVTLVEARPSASAGCRPRPSLLVIDDSADLVAALRLRFKSQGFDVISASTGREGIVTAVGRLPDVITLDLALPDGNGDRVLGALKTNPVTRKIPIIVLTGARPTIQQQQALYRAGATQIVEKPFNADELVTSAKRVVRSRNYSCP